MNYKTMGSAANPLIEIYLNTGEKAKIENGAMVYMQDVAIEGKTNSNGKGGLGGLLKAAARAVVSGESMFITEARGTAQDGANRYRAVDSGCHREAFGRECPVPPEHRCFPCL